MPYYPETDTHGVVIRDAAHSRGGRYAFIAKPARAINVTVGRGGGKSFVIISDSGAFLPVHNPPFPP
jgi:hypothetical protein